MGPAAAPTWLPFVPWVTPVMPVSTPIRLEADAAASSPTTSSAVVPGVPPTKFPATIVLLRVTSPEATNRPPPAPASVFVLSARLPVIVLLVIVVSAPPTAMPPAWTSAVLPLTVVLAIDSVAAGPPWPNT